MSHYRIASLDLLQHATILNTSSMYLIHCLYYLCNRPFTAHDGQFSCKPSYEHDEGWISWVSLNPPLFSAPLPSSDIKNVIHHTCKHTCTHKMDRASMFEIWVDSISSSCCIIVYSLLLLIVQCCTIVYPLSCPTIPCPQGPLRFSKRFSIYTYIYYEPLLQVLFPLLLISFASNDYGPIKFQTYIFTKMLVPFHGNLNPAGPWSKHHLRLPESYQSLCMTLCPVVDDIKSCRGWHYVLYWMTLCPVLSDFKALPQKTM